jgi:hypothetical protein
MSYSLAGGVSLLVAFFTFFFFDNGLPAQDAEPTA